MIAVSGWSISWAAPATSWPREASFSLCTSWLCKRCSFSKLRRESSSRRIKRLILQILAHKDEYAQHQHRGQYGEQTEGAGSGGGVVPAEVHRPSTGKERIASMARRKAMAPHLSSVLGGRGLGLPWRAVRRGRRHPAHGADQGNVVEASRVVRVRCDAPGSPLANRAHITRLPPSGSGRPSSIRQTLPRAAIPSTNTSTPFSTR